MSKFIQIHTLTPYTGALLNRDDAGLAKRLPYGGKIRTRISSQCLKSHWRRFDGEGGLHELGVEPTIRSRRTFQQCIVEPLLESGVSKEALYPVTQAVMKLITGESPKAKKAKKDASEEEKAKEKEISFETKQVILLGKPEVDYLKREIEKLAKEVEGDNDEARDKSAKSLVKGLQKELKENLKSVVGAGFSAAMFGRMVTADFLARADAAIHVAHAFTVHEQESEDDYFSALDELSSGAGELGSGHINSTEINSGIFYGYVVVDVALLVSNLTGVAQKDWQSVDPALASSAIERLIKIMATVSPGAKLGSTAPYARANFVMVEKGNEQPRTLADAFRQAVPLSGHVMKDAYLQLNDYLQEYDKMYSPKSERRLVGIGMPGDLKFGGNSQSVETLDELASFGAKLGAT